MLFGAAGFAMTAVSHSNLIQLLAISAAFVGMLSSTPIIQNLPGTFLRGNAVAAGIGIFNTIGQFGGFVAPYIIGITKEQSGSYAAGIMIIAAGLVIGALIVVALSHTLAPKFMAPLNGNLFEKWTTRLAGALQAVAAHRGYSAFDAPEPQPDACPYVIPAVTHVDGTGRP
jgi:hypothetical protein